MFLRLWHKGKKNLQYRKRWAERLGWGKIIAPANAVLLHCVSVGEVVAATPLINALLAQGTSLVITTMTPTGSDRVISLFGNKVIHKYLPFDVLWALDPFLKQIQPRLVIIFETELWPSLIYALRNRKIPMVLFNARISPASFAHYLWMRPIVAWMLNSFTYVAAQSKPDFERLEELGCENGLHLVGNIKFDISPAVTIEVLEQVKSLKEQVGNRTVLVAASTHANEEELLLQAYNQLKVIDESLLLIVVPRHCERFAEVRTLLDQKQYKYVLRSSGEVVAREHQVLLGDTMGELAVFYRVAFCAFIGGSLVNVGGHNMLEASVLGVPVVTGPILHNFQEISLKLEQADGLKIVQNMEELISALSGWLQHKAIAQTIGRNGQELIVANQGVMIKLLNVVNQLNAGK